ncbi:MAG: hypothetical protein IJC15_00935, partial [Clostridia bacterium]|nr:hypothetical protein [Clostridia bacterium]
TAIALVIRSIIRSIVRKKAAQLRWDLLTVACILLAAASWILNIGWFRVLITISGAPVYHAILLFFLNHKATDIWKKSPRLRQYVRLNTLSYLGIYLLFPDGGDIGSMYMFFSLIRSDRICRIALPLCFVCLVIHIILSILQYKLQKELHAQETLAVQTKNHND